MKKILYFLSGVTGWYGVSTLFDNPEYFLFIGIMAAAMYVLYIVDCKSKHQRKLNEFLAIGTNEAAARDMNGI